MTHAPTTTSTTTTGGPTTTSGPTTTTPTFNGLAAERWNSRVETVSESATLRYVVHGTSDRQVVVDQISAIAPASYGGLERSGKFSIEESSPQVWDIDVEYLDPQGMSMRAPAIDLEVDDWSIRCEARGRMGRVTYGYSERAYPAATAPDQKNMIHVDEHGTPQGMDVPLPGMTLVVSKRVSKTFMTLNYILGVCSIVGKINDDWFLGIGPGHLRFEGARGTIQPGVETLVEYEFSYDYQETADIGDIAAVVREPHEITWVVTKEEKDGNRTVTRPLYAYSTQPHGTADFTTTLLI